MTRTEDLLSAAICLAMAFFALALMTESSGISLNDIIIPLATLLAAFAGSWSAYLLNNQAEIRKQIGQEISNSNDFLLAFMQRMNTLRIFQLDFVDEYRDSPTRMFEIEPHFDFHLPDSPMKPEHLKHLIGTCHKNLIYKLHSLEQRFLEAEKAIIARSRWYLHTVQPLMDNAGMTSGTEYTSEDFKNVLGEYVYSHQENFTNAVVELVDTSVEEGEHLRKELIAALKEIYPGKPILNFVPIEES